MVPSSSRVVLDQALHGHQGVPRHEALEACRDAMRVLVGPPREAMNALVSLFLGSLLEVKLQLALDLADCGLHLGVLVGIWLLEISS